MGSLSPMQADLCKRQVSPSPNRVDTARQPKTDAGEEQLLKLSFLTLLSIY